MDSWRIVYRWNVTPVDGDTFLKYFEEKVTHTLGNYERGEKNSLVLMDNWSGHRKAEVTAVMEELCTSKGALLRFLPAYQPWLNPIEFGFGLFKHHLKSKTAYLRQRDHDIKFETHQALMTAFAAITQTNAASFFKRSGYHVRRDSTLRAENARCTLMLLLLCSWQPLQLWR